MIKVPNTIGAAWDAYKTLAGGYDIPFLKFKGTPRVLDIGANVGAFCMWARQKWPGCPIRAFEPQPEMWPFFLANTDGQVPLIKKAIWHESPVTLYTKEGNCLLTGPTKYAYHDGEPMQAEAIHPKELPPCEVLKLDTEGGELPILQHYKHKPSVILVEAHCEKDRQKIERYLDADYEWVLGELWIRGYCEMKFVRRDFLPEGGNMSQGGYTDIDPTEIGG